MYAYDTHDNPRERRSQPRVPRPHPSEYSADAVEPLAQALESLRRHKQADGVRQHALGQFWVDECPVDGRVVSPESDGQGLCPWDRRRKLVRWAISLSECTGSSFKATIIQLFLTHLDISAVKEVLSSVVPRARGAAVFDFAPGDLAAWRLSVVAVGVVG